MLIFIILLQILVLPIVLFIDFNRKFPYQISESKYCKSCGDLIIFPQDKYYGYDYKLNTFCLPLTSDALR